ncbi:MAG: hypothetical protein LBP27_01335, partial [Treponema sp.]|nr:hypothetical protein [Treponema sp.]
AETGGAGKHVEPYPEGSYRNADGGIVFLKDGSYELYGTETSNTQKGKYVFFNMKEEEFLELRPSGPESLSRITFRVDRDGETITLTRVRVGTRGIQEIELPVSLTKNS